ncbi:MAG: hypothetical protein HYT41_02290 [Candidatus Sungbacteria bacterium]|nr:hypothetical protein [Candidatus Sungbacteria bacterium]
MKVLLDEYGVRKAAMTTIHAYTGTQAVVDTVDQKDLRRGRAAAINIVPSTTGAAEAVVQAIPELKGKFEAISARVPVPVGSLSVITALVGKQTSAEQVNDVFRRASAEPRWSKILRVTDDSIVSADIVGEPFGAIIDAALTKASDGDLLTVFSWYDNEAGYTATLIEHVRRIAMLL